MDSDPKPYLDSGHNSITVFKVNPDPGLNEDADPDPKVDPDPGHNSWLTQNFKNISNADPDPRLNEHANPDPKVNPDPDADPDQGQ